jgi:hypothetical protein
MRILNLQNAVLVSLVVAAVASSACSSSDTPRPTANGGATGTAGAGPTAGAGNNTPGGGDSSGTAGSPVVGGGAPGTAGSPPVGGGAPGTAGAGGGSTGPSLCDGLGTKTLDMTSAFVDNFECMASPTFCRTAAQAMTDPDMNPANISFGWSTFNDLGTAGVDAADNKVKLLQIMPGAATTGHAGQYMGSAANVPPTPNAFGVGAIYNVAIDPVGGVYCANIEAFDGVSFWAKTGIAAGSTINVNFVLPNTNGQSTNPAGMQAGGDCVVASKTCFNHPRKAINLTSAWTQYNVTFAEATGGSAKVGSLIQMLGFLTATATWDFSLDEIAFYKGTPPAGAIMDPGAAAAP